MDETGKTFAPELSPVESRRWVGRLVIAVVLGAAIWNFVVAFTENLVLPLMARLMDVDPQSPLYLGKGNIGAPALFTAVVELCFAGIVAAILNSRLQRLRVRLVRRVAVVPSSPLAISSPPGPAVSTSPERVTSASPAPASPAIQAQPAPAVGLRPAAAHEAEVPAPPSVASAAVAAQAAAIQAEPAAVQAAPAQKTPQPAKPEKPGKPKPAKVVYYNLVGEPIDSDDEE